jgi:hypothetical protein
VVPMRKEMMTCWRMCAECARKHSAFGAHSRNMRMWAEIPVHVLIHGQEENFE